MDATTGNGDSPHTAATAALHPRCRNCDGDLSSVDGNFCPFCGGPRAEVVPPSTEAAVAEAVAADALAGDLTVADILAPADVDPAAAEAADGEPAEAALRPSEAVDETESEVATEPAVEFQRAPAEVGTERTAATVALPGANGEPTELSAAVAPPEPVGGDLPVSEPLVAVEAQHVEADEGERKQRRRRRLLVVAGVVAIALVAGAAFALTRDSGPTYDLDAALVSSHETVSDVVADASRAGTLAQVTAVGDAAAEAIDSLDATRLDLELVSNRDDRVAAAATLDGYIDLLEQLVILGTLDAAKVTDWPDAAGAIEKELGVLRDNNARLLDRDLPLGDDVVDDVDAAAGKLEVVMSDMTAKLTDWAAEVDRITKDKATQKSALDTYVMTFRGQIDKYAGLRNEMSQYVADLYDTTYADDYAFFGGALAQRQDVHAAMSAAQPPPALVPAHTAIVAAVNESLGAVQSAVRGLEQSQYLFFYEITSTPGWNDFSRRSDQITKTYNAAVSNWDLAVAGEEKRIAAIKPPTRPAV